MKRVLILLLATASSLGVVGFASHSTEKQRPERPAIVESASTCTRGIGSSSTRVSIHTYGPQPCYLVQARMSRFYNGTPYTYFGPASPTVSTVEMSNGYRIQNSVRWIVSVSGSWVAWRNV